MAKEWCERCEDDLDLKNKYELEGPWGVPSGSFVCESCAEAEFDSYMESRIA
jgi:hypothetical protein